MQTIVFTLENIQSSFVILLLYVDDMLIFGTNITGIFETKKYLTSMFKMKDWVKLIPSWVLKLKT